jgi:HSP20 family protein
MAEPATRFPMTDETDDARHAAARPFDIVEHEHGYRLTAELPGIDEKDISVTFADGTLTIKGEKQEQKADKQKDYYLSERRYGSFQRSFRVPQGVDPDRIEASFKHGVLTVNLPKSVQAQTAEKRIDVKVT